MWTEKEVNSHDDKATATWAKERKTCVEPVKEKNRKGGTPSLKLGGDTSERQVKEHKYQNTGRR